jgi:predicted aconitase
MKLTAEEQAMLAGEFGEGVKKAIEIVSALGNIFGAENLAPVSSVQVAGVSYKNLGDAGLEFLADWASQGGMVRVPTTLNPAGLDTENWRELGFEAGFAEKQNLVLAAFSAMGISPTCTCTPYYVGNLPRQGDHLAWSESSAVSFANSVLGARTNREGGPSALAAAICGRTARYGLHLPQERRAGLLVDVRCPVSSFADFGALGIMIGKIARNRIPYFHGDGLQLTPLSAGGLPPDTKTIDRLKGLGAAMAASGAVALYHLEGVTPEAGDPDIILPEAERVVISDLAEGYAALNKYAGADIDLVWIGCPHASMAELQQVIELLAGRRVKASLWVTMARELRRKAVENGLAGALEALGGKIVADTCLVVAPMDQLGFRSLATASGKGAYYAPTNTGMSVHYGPLEECIEAAVTGHWE